MASDLLTALADTLFQNLDWPGPEDEQWRRTHLARLLPKGALDTAAAHRAASPPGRSPAPKAEPAGRLTPLQAAPIPQDPPTRRLTPLQAAPQTSPSPAPPLPPAARIITAQGIPLSITLSPQAEQSGLSIQWAAADQLPPSLDRIGRDTLDAAPDRIAAWHWRDIPGALVVSLPANTRLEAPVLIEEHFPDPDPSGPLFSAPHLHVQTAESAELTLLWSFENTPTEIEGLTPIVNAGITAHCAPNSRARIALRQNLPANAVFFTNDTLIVQRDAVLDFFASHTGSALVKTQSSAVLAGEGSDARLSGVYAARPGRHMDIGTLQQHQSPRASSDALFKGAVRPGGRSVFQGLIEVAPKAAKTDAYLTNNNLVLGDGARADSLPQLNILTDDVKCSHGSTTGKLNESQLFYLRSRGYSPEEAVNELTRAFLVEVTDRAPAAFTNLISTDLDKALSEGP